MNSLLQHTTVAILYVYKTFNDMQYISRPYDLFLSAPIIPVFCYSALSVLHHSGGFYQIKLLFIRIINHYKVYTNEVNFIWLEISFQKDFSLLWILRVILLSAERQMAEA